MNIRKQILALTQEPGCLLRQPGSVTLHINIREVFYTLFWIVNP